VTWHNYAQSQNSYRTRKLIADLKSERHLEVIQTWKCLYCVASCELTEDGTDVICHRQSDSTAPLKSADCSQNS